MEDNYDISLRSRNRDKDVLAAANRAIVSRYLNIISNPLPNNAQDYFSSPSSIVGQKIHLE